jgi:hypothetical protein
MKWFENFVAGKSVVLEDARDVGMHELVVTNSILRTGGVQLTLKTPREICSTPTFSFSSTE